MTPNQFKKIRENLGFTQQEMASVLGLKSERTIRRYESGFSKIKKQTEFFLKNYCNAGK